MTALDGYARADQPVADRDEYSTALVLDDPSALHVAVGQHRVRLVDRRLVGVDWLRAPAPPAPPPPRFVFASLKGGVGRSTALAVVAAHLASRGKRVLAVDLDLEAPGLGWTLLSEDTLPPFGMLDVLVENSISGIDAAFLVDLVGPSALAHQGGRIDVIPAFGRRSVDHPADVLAKLARAYMENVRPDGSVATILDQVRAVIDEFSEPARYDAILIDARAGLHETSASAILGLGAEVFLFGLDEPQTFRGYAALLAHLARFISKVNVPNGPSASPWFRAGRQWTQRSERHLPSDVGNSSRRRGSALLKLIAPRQYRCPPARRSVMYHGVMRSPTRSCLPPIGPFATLSRSSMIRGFNGSIRCAGRTCCRSPSTWARFAS